MRAPMVRYAVQFLAILALLFGVALLDPVQVYLEQPWTALFASVCGFLVMQLDATALVQGAQIWSTATGWGVHILPACNGVTTFFVLCAALMAFPAPWQHKLRGLAEGFAVIQALNLVRVVSLYFIGQWDKEWFHLAHTFVWQGLMMLAVFSLWWMWVQTVLIIPRERSGSSAPRLVH